ncbi:MAG: hypothetical protein IPM82_20945 [Saprospiraceae bacterium]|nr:hypothetical protein [Saprospiraceae bacterium]
MKLNNLILLTTLFFAILSNCIGQTTLWSNYFPNGAFYDMTRMPDGKFIAVGRKSEKDDWLVANVDQNGNVAWQKNIELERVSYALSVVPDENGSFLVLGSWNGKIEQPILTGKSKLIKFDKNGEILWQKSYSREIYSNLDRLIKIRDNGYLLFGLYNSGKEISHEHRNYDSWMVRVDINGEILWEKIIEGSKDNSIKDVIQLRNGQLLAIGFNIIQSKKFEDEENCQTTLIQLTSDGNIIGSKTICGSGLENADRIIQTPDNGYLLLGFNYSKDFRKRKPQEGEKVNDDISICKLNRQLEIEWIKRYGGSDYDAFKDCIKTEKGILILAKSSSEDGDFATAKGEGKVVVFDINWNGKIKWARRFDGIGKISTGVAIEKIDSEVFIVAGLSFPKGAWLFAFKKDK